LVGQPWEQYYALDVVMPRAVERCMQVNGGSRLRPFLSFP
jgi:hypothetical protein